MILSPRQFAGALRTLGGHVANDAWTHVASRVMGGAKTYEDMVGTMTFTPAEVGEIRAYNRGRSS